MVITSRRQLMEGAVDALSIRSPTSFSWFGQPVHEVPAQLERQMARDTARAYLRYAMQVHLYGHFYCRGTAAPMLDAPDRPAVSGLTPFVEALSASNLGIGTREPGWHVRGTENRTVVVERHGLKLWVLPRDTWPHRRGALAQGASVSVTLPKELLQLSPGFYMALGDRWLEIDSRSGVVRFYWHVRSEGAAALVAAVTARLNRARLAFRLKVVNDPHRYTRCDAGVLYARKRDYGLLSPLIADVHREVSIYLEPATPAFTRRLAVGLGLAEDPGHGESFGMSRCGLLAEGLIRAHEETKESLADRMDVIERCFAEAGIRLETPFLNPGSTGRYGFRIP